MLAKSYQSSGNYLSSSFSVHLPNVLLRELRFKNIVSRQVKYLTAEE